MDSSVSVEHGVCETGTPCLVCECCILYMDHYFEHYAQCQRIQMIVCRNTCGNPTNNYILFVSVGKFAHPDFYVHGIRW